MKENNHMILPKLRRFKKNAAASTLKYANDCSERARKLFQKEQCIDAGSWNNIEINKFWLWLESTKSLSKSTKKTYARAICRTLEINEVETKKEIIKTKKATRELILQIQSEVISYSLRFKSEDVNYASHAFYFISITGINISSITKSRIISENEYSNDGKIYFNITIEVFGKNYTTKQVLLSSVTISAYYQLKSAIKSFKILKNNPENEIKKSIARISYFIQKILYIHGHTLRSAKRYFPAAHGYLVN
jgi:uncharacterized protein YjhX (UPF0386 family)